MIKLVQVPDWWRYGLDAPGKIFPRSVGFRDQQCLHLPHQIVALVLLGLLQGSQLTSQLLAVRESILSLLIHSLNIIINLYQELVQSIHLLTQGLDYLRVNTVIRLLLVGGKLIVLNQDYKILNIINLHQNIPHHDIMTSWTSFTPYVDVIQDLRPCQS